MALSRVISVNYSIILNPRFLCRKLQPLSLNSENLSARFGTSAWRRKISSDSKKPCYDNGGVVTFPCLKQLLAESNIQLFDVRTREEVEAGKIPGATNIPLNEIQEAFSLSPKEFQEKYNVPKPELDDENIAFHCRTGKRAQEAIQILLGMGFKRTHNYTGGWVEWQKAMDEDMAAIMATAAEAATAANS